MELIMVGGLLGVTAGSGLGVTLAGQASGVEGNWMGAYVGTVLGTGASMLMGSISTLLVVPAACAVIGFNIGATLRDTGQPATLPWKLDLPVLTLEF